MITTGQCAVGLRKGKPLFEAGSSIYFSDMGHLVLDMIPHGMTGRGYFASLPISNPASRAKSPTYAAYMEDGMTVIVWDDWGVRTRFCFGAKEDRDAMLAACEANLPRKER